MLISSSSRSSSHDTSLVLLGVDEIKLCRDGDDRAFLTSRYDPDQISGYDCLHPDENHGGDRLAPPSNEIVFICLTLIDNQCDR